MDKLYRRISNLHSQVLEGLCVFLSLSCKIWDRAMIRVVRVVAGVFSGHPSDWDKV